MKTDTIAAIATATGGAISIIRISGKDSIAIANRIFSKDISKYKSHTAHVGKILDNKKNIIDQVLLIVMKSPNSFTSEDVVEINCHGGKIVTKKILEEILKNGARLANPGEFSLRAFLNNKIDLSQAEAIQNIISANNEVSLKCASKQLDGELFKKISFFQNSLVDLAAEVEAYIDFPEEDLELINRDKLLKKLERIVKQMKNLKNTFSDGKIIQDANIAIIGSVNVGKSSLMNLLCKDHRSIVTNIPGTTRDIVSEKIQIGEFNYNISDTAGIRENANPIEKEGIEKAKKTFKDSDFVILVLDSSKALDQNDLDLLKDIKQKKHLIAWNKIDIEQKKYFLEKIDPKNIVKISAKNNIGIETLKEKLQNLLYNQKSIEKDCIITQKRHFLALENSLLHLKEAIKKISSYSFELISEDIKLSLKELSTIIGQDISEEILSSIFSKFCIGK